MVVDSNVEHHVVCRDGGAVCAQHAEELIAAQPPDTVRHVRAEVITQLPHTVELPSTTNGRCASMATASRAHRVSYNTSRCCAVAWCCTALKTTMGAATVATISPSTTNVTAMC